MLTSITFGLLASENYMCQIQIESVLCLGFIYYFFLLNNIEIALSGNCFSECI